MMRADAGPSTAVRRRRRVAGAAVVCASAACVAPPRPAATVVYASGTDLESVNPLVSIHPLSRQVQRYALFVTLARLDGALAPRPYFARAWAWSPDRRTLTFRLEPSLRWHDGTPTTARDAAFTLDAARDPATGYPRAGDLAAVSEIAAPDDTTLVLRFREPAPRFPLVLAELPILPRHLLRSVPRGDMRRASFNVAPIGNGPFRFVRREPGQRWVFERDTTFPAAMGGPPRIERLVIAVVDEATTKFAGLVSGALDLAGIAPSMAELAAQDPTVRVVAYPVLFATALVFNTARPPFDDPRVRRAVSLSLDRERIVAGALAGFGVPAAGPVPPDNPLAAPASPPRDARLADSLLDAAGWHRAAGGGRSRAGRALAFELLTVGSGDNAVEQLIQADLALRGVRVEIRQMEHAAFLAQARAPVKRFDALLTGVPGDLSLAQLEAMYDSRLAGGALDYGGYHTPRLDSMFAAVRRAGDDRGLRQAWGAVQEELARAMPAAWIYHARGVQGVARRLRGVHMDLRGEMPTLTEWHLAHGDAGRS